MVVEGDIVLTKEQADIYYSKGQEELINSQTWIKEKYATRWDHQILYEVSTTIGTYNTLYIYIA